MRSRRVPIGVFLALLLARETGAQAAEPKRNTIVSVQPLWLALTTYQAEVERVLGPTTTVGIAGSSWSTESNSRKRLSGDVKVRYYPTGRAPEGFSVAAALGLVRVTQAPESGNQVSDVGYAMGVFLDYGLFFEPTRRYYAAVGVGSKMLRVDIPTGGWVFPPNRYVTFRFSLGVGF